MDGGETGQACSKAIARAEQMLAAMGGGAPDAAAALCSRDVRLEIPGDDGVLPWIGHRTGRQAVTDFIASVRALTEPISFEVEEILASATRAVIVGELATRIIATDKVVETAFAIILTFRGDEVTRIQMLEDSFAVSRAART